MYYFIAFIVLPVSSKVLYTRTGENIIINCSNPNISVWQYVESNDILAQCDSPVKSMNGINKKLTRSSRLHITANCDRLQIQNFSIEDVGTYQCLYTTKDSKGSNNYRINIQLRSKHLNFRVDLYSYVYQSVHFSFVIQANPC